MTDIAIKDLLTYMMENRGSDIHITAGAPPTIRVDSELLPVQGYGPLTPEQAKNICYQIINEEQMKVLESHWELDFSFGIDGLSRFRSNIYYQKGTVATAIRAIPFKMPEMEAINLPKVSFDLIKKPRGLILVTGPTGSGKSTTLASMLNRINQERHEHILTIEDPIEFVHNHKQCIVNQREVGADTKKFSNALKSVLRQDPDIVLIGEMRDLETIEAALTIAETGQLVFATLHTNSAAQTINRIIDVFPPHQQQQIRALLSFVLEGVFCQQLIPKIGGGRVMAAEVMVPNPAIRNLIREDKVHQIQSMMEMGQDESGMITLNQSLVNYVKKGVISKEDGIKKCTDIADFERLMKK